MCVPRADVMKLGQQIHKNNCIHACWSWFANLVNYKVSGGNKNKIKQFQYSVLWKGGQKKKRKPL